LSKARMTYFEEDDVLHLAISDDLEGGSIEISPNITAELNAHGDLIGIEILNASDFVGDTVRAKLSAHLEREEAEARDTEILSRLADGLNAEAEDVLGYQVTP